MVENNNTHKILITGAGGPAGVNVMKSLKESLTPPFIYGTDINPYHIEFAKAVADKTAVVPRCNDPRYPDELNKIIDAHDIKLVHPQPDIEVKYVSKLRDKLHCKTALPSKETVKICQDKHRSANIWKDKGFGSIESIEIRPNHIEDDVHRAFNEFGEKLWFRAAHGAGGTGSTPADNPETAIHWIKYWESRGKSWQWMAQEYLPGRNIAFQSVWKNGRLITSQARERLEYIYPYLAPSGVTGTPVVAKTIHDDDVNKMAEKAVLAIDEDATGVFCVDLKLDVQKNPMPTEINVGRFFTTSYFFSHASMEYGREKTNMPWLLMKVALDEKLPDDIPKFNALPEGLHWIRHIDCGHFLIEEKNLEKEFES